MSAGVNVLGIGSLFKILCLVSTTAETGLVTCTFALFMLSPVAYFLWFTEVVISAIFVSPLKNKRGWGGNLTHPKFCFEDPSFYD
jgi:hypothetical protein